MTRPYDPAEKPDPNQCPRELCFMWHGPRSYFASGKLLTQVPTMPSAAPGSDGHCACPFGLCQRYNPENGTADGYEPHEPNLREAGLPWFYFIPRPEKLGVDFRPHYIEDSEALWGERHWEHRE